MSLAPWDKDEIEKITSSLTPELVRRVQGEGREAAATWLAHEISGLLRVHNDEVRSVFLDFLRTSSSIATPSAVHRLRLPFDEEHR